MGYKINGKTYKLKELTLNEADQVNKLLAYTADSIELGNEQTKKFLSLVLEQDEGIINGSLTPSHFDNCLESTALEVLRDFFTRKIEQGSDLRNYFNDLQKKLKK